MSGVLTDGGLGLFGPEAEYRAAIRGVRYIDGAIRSAIEKGDFGNAQALIEERQRRKAEEAELIRLHSSPVWRGGRHDGR